MSIVLKNSEVTQFASESLKLLSDIKISAKTSYWIARLIKKYDEIAEAFQKTLKETQEQYMLKDDEGKPVPVEKLTGEKDEDGKDKTEVVEGAFQVTNPEKYSKEIDELLGETNIIELEPLSIELFDDAKIEPKIFVPILWMIKDAEEKKVE